MSALAHWLTPHESNNQRAKLLHPSSVALVIGNFLSLQIFVTSFSARYPTILGFAAQIAPSEVIRLTNVERASKGLPALKSDPLLTAAAARKAGDMIARDYWAHVSPVGTQPWFFISEAGYSYRYAGENLARDFSDPASVVKAWMNSPSHRDNLLSNRYQDIGIAVIDGRLTGHDTTLVVQMFGTKLTAGVTSDVTDTASFTVDAAPAEVAVPAIAGIQVPVTNQFDLTKYFSIGVLSVFLIILGVDMYVVSQQKLVRWTSKSLAHFVFLACLIVAAITIVRGKII